MRVVEAVNNRRYSVKSTDATPRELSGGGGEKNEKKKKKNSRNLATAYDKLVKYRRLMTRNE
jgi:hypothetical protein